MSAESRERRLKQHSRMTREIGPSTKAQSSRWVRWEEQRDWIGQPFDSTKIPLTKLHQMRRDPMIAFALLFVKVPLIRAPWYIRSNDAKVAAFVDNALRRIWPRLVYSYCNSLDFGYSAMVKRYEQAKPNWTYLDGEEEKPVWDSKIPALIWKPFLALPPDDVEPTWNDSGEFEGIYLRNPADKNGFPKTREYEKGNTRRPKPDIPLEHALWATNEKDSVFGSLWGYPRIGYAYRFWWSWHFRWALADRHFEKDADPPLVVYYPDEQGLDADGNEVDYQSLALMLGENLRSGSTIAFPSTPITGDDGRVTGNREWEANFLEGGGNFAAFQESFNYLDVAKLRAILVPEQALLEGSGGTSSRNVAEQLGDVFYESQAVLLSEIDDHVNRFIIPQLVEANFGKGKSAEKVTRGFASQDLDMARQIITLVGQTNPDNLEVNVRELLDQMGIPLLNPKDARKKREEAQAAAGGMGGGAPPQGQQMPWELNSFAKPEPQRAQNGQAGVNQWGFYYNDRDKIRIDLADTEGVAPLPPAPQFESDEVMAILDELEAEMKAYLKDSYGEFADILSRVPDSVALSDDGKHLNLGISAWAIKALGGWLETRKDREAKVNRVAGMLRSIMDTAGNREIARHRLGDVNWDANNDHVVNWAGRRAAELVKGIDETTRKELQRFVERAIEKSQTPKQIADQIEEHFSSFPDWRARRIARTETANAYNNATLEAYKAAGIDKVRARDAVVRHRSDPECIERDGQVFTIEEAFVETMKEHPNGTLSWLPQKTPGNMTGLSFEVVTALSWKGEPITARFDTDEYKVYLDQDISYQDRQMFLSHIGNSHPELYDEVHEYLVGEDSDA